MFGRESIFLGVRWKSFAWRFPRDYWKESSADAACVKCQIIERCLGLRPQRWSFALRLEKKWKSMYCPAVPNRGPRVGPNSSTQTRFICTWVVPSSYLAPESLLINTNLIADGISSRIAPDLGRSDGVKSSCCSILQEVTNNCDSRWQGALT